MRVRPHSRRAYCQPLMVPSGFTPRPVSCSALDYPMDFSAWFEAYLGSRWYTFDARHNMPRIGRILMATGRDATDVALSTSFGPSFLAGFSVTTDEVHDTSQRWALRGRAHRNPQSNPERLICDRVPFDCCRARLITDEQRDPHRFVRRTRDVIDANHRQDRG
jgi:hypothetical protein